MPALEAIFSANAEPFRRELRAAQALASAAGKKIESDLSGGGKVRGGAIRESLVLLREIGRGDLTRIPGSFSILISQLGLLPVLLNPITIAIAAAGAAIYGVIKLTDSLSDKLSGLKFPTFHPDFIVRQLQGINQAAEGWKKISEAVSEAIDKYGSAEQVAKRLAETTKEQYAHERKIDTLHKERDLAKARTPEQKSRIEARYDQEEADRSQRERDDQIKQKQNEADALQKEATRIKLQADAIQVPSEQHDADLKKQYAERAKIAQAKIDEFESNRGFKKGLSVGELATGTINSFLPTGVSNEEYIAGIRAQYVQAKEEIGKLNAVKQTAADNDEKRKKKEHLTGLAAKSAEAAATIRAGLPDEIKKNEQTTTAETELLLAKRQAERAKADSRKSPGTGHLTNLQSVGAFISPGQVTLIDVNRKIERNTSIIANHITRRQGWVRDVARNGKPAYEEVFF